MIGNTQAINTHSSNWSKRLGTLQYNFLAHNTHLKGMGGHGYPTWSRVWFELEGNNSQTAASIGEFDQEKNSFLAWVYPGTLKVSGSQNTTNVSMCVFIIYAVAVRTHAIVVKTNFNKSNTLLLFSTHIDVPKAKPVHPLHSRFPINA